MEQIRQSLRFISERGRIKPPKDAVDRHIENSLKRIEYEQRDPILAFSGPSGSGKTTTVEMLEKFLPASKPFHGGEWFRDAIREQQGKNTDTTGYVDRPLSMDDHLDQVQRNLMKRAIEDPNAKVLDEARLAIVISTEMLQEYESHGLMNPGIVRILITASENERMERIVRRTLQEQEKNPHLPVLTREQIIEETLAREAGDRKQWMKSHPILRSGRFDANGEEIPHNPYDPTLMNTDGTPLFYDHCIDTTHMSLFDTVMNTLSLLEQNGVIIELEKKEDSGEIDIFPAAK